MKSKSGRENRIYRNPQRFFVPNRDCSAFCLKRTVKSELRQRVRKIGRYNKMASSKEYLNFILNQLSGLEGITYRAMMGEFIIYYNGKIAGGIYDDRFLVKPVKAAMAILPDAKMELPYEGGKEMLLVEDVDNREFLEKMFTAIYEELPEPKKKK